MTDDSGAAAARHSPGHPPTYTSWLRGLSNAELGALLAARPDLMSPVPADIAALAARAASRPAVLRVLDQLDRFTLRVLEALLVLDGQGEQSGRTSTSEISAALPAPAADTARALDRLRTNALIWDSAQPGAHPQAIAALHTALTQPAGLGPPLAELLAGLSAEQLTRMAEDLKVALQARPDQTASTGGDSAAAELARALTPAERLREALESAGVASQRALDQLLWGPPNGTVTQAHRHVSIASAASPIDRLLARGLLVASDEHTVTLPREVALWLRGGRLFERVSAAPPELTGTQRPARAIENGAAGQAFTLLRAVAEMLELWTGDPPGVLRSGGLGMRDLRRTAAALDVDDTTAALFIETAWAAGLIAASGDLGGDWLPTPEYDAWLGLAPAQRWVQLARAWLCTTRVAALNGTKDAHGRARNVLGEGLDRHAAAEVRLAVLRALAAAPPGTAPSEESVGDYLAWSRPRRQGPGFDELAQAARQEAALLGLTGRGVLASYAAALIEDTPPDPSATDGAGAAAALAPLLPEPLEHFMVQGDLTAVAPGPLVPELARELALAAEVESTGGATVYRFTADSIRRALDAGHGAADLTGMLERHSTTPLPQPLRYLISDVARRHGRVRVGAASSYLRCDDPALLDELVNDRRTGELALFRLAPTVVASRSTRPLLLERLRDLGYQPVPEATDGSVQLSRQEIRRAEEQPRQREAPQPPSTAELRAAAVRAIRAGDEAATAARSPIAAPGEEPPRSATAATLAALSAAATEGSRVWIGYLDTEGLASSRIVEPARVDGGYLTAYDATRAAVHRFAVHRITSVAALGPQGVESGLT